MANNIDINSWKKAKKYQEIIYPNQDKLQKILKKLQAKKPLVDITSINYLLKDLQNVCKQQKLLLVCGPCAENIKFDKKTIYSTIQMVKEASNIIQEKTGFDTVCMGRLAGQFAKPRSSLSETIGDITLPSYRGDIVNEIEFSRKKREPNPKKMIIGYKTSKKTIKLIQKVFPNFFVSHECLLLPYENALTREEGNLYYLESTHMPWIGERTRKIDGSHIEFLKHITNPIGIKVSDQTNISELIEIIKILNPQNIPGKIALIIRMGPGISNALPKVIDAIKKNNLEVIFLTDPMHQNTKKIGDTKTRYWDDIVSEVTSFVKICKQNNVFPAGMHLESVGVEVTECVGLNVKPESINERYLTKCDPCLNKTQTLELVKIFCGIINNKNEIK